MLYELKSHFPGEDWNLNKTKPIVSVGQNLTHDNSWFYTQTQTETEIAEHKPTDTHTNMSTGVQERIGTDTEISQTSCCGCGRDDGAGGRCRLMSSEKREG